MTKIPKVFLDANIVISAGKPPGDPILERVGDLVRAELITVLTTDLTITEVSKKHAENDYEVIKDIGRQHFRKIVKQVVGANIPEITKAQMKARLTAAYKTSTEKIFKTLNAKILAIDNVKPSVVFAAYAASEGLFTGESKKDQFPDAFIFECLKVEASSASPVIIISNDRDFEKPVKDYEYISLAQSLPALFKTLGLEIEAPELDAFLAEHKNELIAAANRELSDWGLIGDVDDADIEETDITDIELQEIQAFKPTEDGGSFLVVGRMTVKANISYTHPDWDRAIYDSEDKVLIPFDEVSGETEINFDVSISMSIGVDNNGFPAEIEDLRFRNSDFQYVELHPHDPYEYM